MDYPARLLSLRGVAFAVDGESGKRESQLIVIEVSCRLVHKLVSEYVDGELDPELRYRIDQHLLVCRHCTAIVEGTRNVVRLAFDGRVFELPPAFAERLMKRLRVELPE